MPSSLAAQLAQGASLNAPFLVDRSKRKSVESYLFTGRDAAQHDLDTIHALAVNGLLQLRSLDRRLGAFEDSLLSSAGRDTDRTLKTAEENARLDATIEEFLMLLGPFILEAPTGKILEWLVRRFRVNEFNVEAALSTFLPYHESPHFAKMLTILHIPESPLHSYLLGTKTATLPLARHTLVVAMSKNPDLVRFISGLIPAAIRARAVHRTLIAFHTSVLMDFIARSHHISRNGLEEGVLVSIISSLLAPLTHEDSTTATGVLRDAILSSYAVLSALSNACHLAPATIRSIVESMLAPSPALPAKHVLRALVAVCTPQDMQEKWSKRSSSSFLHLLGLGWTLEEFEAYAGWEKLLCPFLPRMVSNLSETEQAVLGLLISGKNTHVLILEHLSKQLLQRVLSPKEDRASDRHVVCLRLLAALQQRHLSIFTNATATLAAVDASLQPAVDQLVLSLATTGGVDGASAKMDVILASVHADPGVRAIAVRDIYKALAAWGDVDADEVTALRTSLQERIADTSPAVVAALYAEPKQLIPVLTENTEAYLAHVATAVNPVGTSAPRALVRAHVDFMSFHFLPALPDEDPETDALVRKAFQTIFFPHLLLTNPRHKTARLVWSAITDARAERGIGSFELVLGCADTYAWGMKNGESANTSPKKGEDEKDPQVQTMAKVNISVAARLAELIAISDDKVAHTSFLLASLASSDTHARLLAVLVLRSLLSSLSGEMQVSTAWRILDVVGSESIASMGKFMGGVDSLQTFLSDESLRATIVLKPNSGNTKDKLFAALLALIPLIPRPNGVQLKWMVEESSEDVAGSYINLIRKLYALSNSESMLPILSANLLRALFIGLGPDALLFLAGIWSSAHVGSASGSEGERVAHAALSHAVAFFAAHQGAPNTIDFQTIVPSLVAQLQSQSKIVREAALECIALVNNIAQASKPSSIYAMDEVYAAGSANIQFIDWPDFGRYLGSIITQRDHFVSSGGYLLDFYAEHLTKAKGEGKKDTSYKQRVLCYLLSHVQACPLSGLRAAIMRSLSKVSSSVKVELLHDLIGDLFKKEKSALEGVYGAHAESFVKDVISCFDTSVCSALRDSNGKEWALFSRVVTRSFLPGFFPSARQQVVYALEHGVYQGLDVEQKLELCKLLLSLAREGDGSVSEVKGVLANVLRDEAVIIRLVTFVRPSASDSTARGSKRTKVDDTSFVVPGDDQLSSLILIAEVLSTISLPASLDLISSLLETLSAVAQTASGLEGESAYAQQLLMNTIEAAASPVLTAQKAGTKMGTIRLDVLIELIRVSSNPQTFHQALLLIAHIAPLARDSIIHNLMPIFTFMGSNVFHRDDAYSFRVVQKTIESIAPVMIASLKESYKEPLRLWISARQFLHIFTDAANHVPRHRRTHFFSHLVDVLGPDEFLAPVCMLLIDKVANRATKQTIDDAQATMNLPLMLMQKRDVVHQVTAMKSVLGEAMLQLGNLKGIDQVTFLGDIVDEGQPLTSASGLPRRIQALIMFVGFTVRQASPSFLVDGKVSSEAVNGLVSSLLDISGEAESLKAQERGAIVHAVQASLHSVLSVVSAQDFLDIVLGMLQSNKIKLQEGALVLIKERVGRIADEVRQKAKSTVSSIIASLISVLSSQSPLVLLPSTLEALTSMITTTVPGEESSLLTTVTILVHFVQNRMHQSLALGALRPLVGKLGPRLIPHLQSVVREAVSIIQDKDVDSDAGEQAVGVLSSSLSALPTFWGKHELMAVLQVFVHGSYIEEVQAGLNSFMKALTRKVPARTMLSAMCDAYSELQVSGSKSASARYVAFFIVLKRSLHAAPRNEVQAQLRPLFKLFLDAFERRQRVEEVDDDEAEEHVIQAFVELIVKLNEASFRPLYRRLFDWAFGNDENVFTKITFCKVYSALLDYFKGLMTGYMSFLLVPFKTILAQNNTESSEQQALWSSVIEIVTQSLADDEGAFWRDEQLKDIAGPLVAQVPVCVEMGLPGEGTQLQECLSNLVDVVSDDALLKSTNLGLLMHTRADEVRLRMYALQCAQVLWRNHGAKLLGLVAESATFVAESAEDESDAVVEEALRLKDAMEAVAGSISQL